MELPEVKTVDLGQYNTINLQMALAESMQEILAEEAAAGGMPEEDTEIYQKLRKTDGAIIAVRFGAGNGKRMERLLGNLKKQDCSILGAVIVEPDENFLKMYYIGKGYGAPEAGRSNTGKARRISNSRAGAEEGMGLG